MEIAVETEATDLLTEAEAGREIATLEAPLPATPASMLQVIARATTDPRVDVQKMEALLRMQEKLVANQARADFNEAMSRLQLKLPRIPKLGVVDRGPGKGRFPYGRWEDIDRLVRPLMNEEGFSLSFDTKARDDGWIIVTGTLRHRAGHFETSSIGPLPPDTSGNKNPAQAMGSSAAYGKRYTSSNLLNLTFEGADDDGEAGGATLIDEASVKALSDLLSETDSNVSRFLEAVGVVELSEIQAKDFSRAVNLLMAKKRKLREERERGEPA
jgi:hypothetical protein